jgi:ribosomal protein S18 acetylase RimI-like enzyme
LATGHARALRGGLELRRACKEDALRLTGWFPDQTSCLRWGGRDFRFPFTPETFLADLKLDERSSYALMLDSTELCGFGQYYLREGRCHLARLAVSPSRQRLGFGTWLATRLIELGARLLNVEGCSLFVDLNNTGALALYARLGFSQPECAGSLQTPGICYLTRACGGEVAWG